MYLRYGSYTHASAEAAVTITRDALTDQAGRHYGQRERWTIQGRLDAATPSALTTAIAALEAAYSLNYQAIGLFQDDGTATQHVRAGTTNLGGTRVVQGPSFERGEGAEYSTFRHYTVVVECEFAFSSVPATLVIAWAESIAFAGGGPRFVYRQPLQGLPQRQLVAQATPFRVTQSGRAVGLAAYPLPSAPLWPAAEHVDQRQVAREHPRRVGSRYVEWPVTWSYQFEAAAPMVGDPPLWRS